MEPGGVVWGDGEESEQGTESSLWSHHGQELICDVPGSSLLYHEDTGPGQAVMEQCDTGSLVKLQSYLPLLLSL